MRDKEITTLQFRVKELETGLEFIEKKYAQLSKKEIVLPEIKLATAPAKDHKPLLKSMPGGKEPPPGSAQKQGPGAKNEANLVEKALQEEIKQLKQTIIKYDEEMYMLKDMVKSTALQIKVKDSELKRAKKRNPLESQSMPGSPSRRKNNSTLLPSLRDTNENDYESTRLDKLSELSSKFKQVQLKGRFIDRAIQTGGGGQKHA